jgi:hypothetical protein
MELIGSLPLCSHPSDMVKVLLTGAVAGAVYVS